MPIVAERIEREQGGRVAAMRPKSRPGALTVVALCAAIAGTPADGVTAQPRKSAAPVVGDGGSDDGDSVTVRYWVAGCSVAEDLWKYRKSSTIFCDERGRTLASAHGVMAWPDYLMATEIDSIVISGEGLAPLDFALEWSIDDSFAPERSVKQLETSSDREVRFVLAGLPEWRGLIRRFRLTWIGQPPTPSRIVAAWARRDLRHESAR